MKKKTKKEIKFDPADYYYMDKIPFEGYIWEFIRRSKDYKQKYTELKKWKEDNPKNKNKLISEIKLLDINPKSICPECLDGHHNINSNNFIIGKEKEFILPNPEIKYSEFESGLKPNIINITPMRIFTCEDCKEIKKLNGKEPVLCDYLAITNPKSDTLYVGISKRANINDINKMLIPTIKKYLEPRKIKIRTDKWKYYLITHDLKLLDKEYREIADILSEAYPSNDPDKVFSEKNIEGYYKNALALINGGYKKYIF